MDTYTLNEININGVILPIREYKGKRVVTFKDIDTVHKRPEGTARKRFNDNRKHFIENVDYFKITPSEYRSELGDMDIRQNNLITIITESGYLMIVKSLTDDTAWDVQRKLVNVYFSVKDDINNHKLTTPLTREELAAYMMYNAQIIDGIKTENEHFLKSIKETNKTLLAQQLNSLNTLSDFIKDFCKCTTSQTEKYSSMMASGLYTLNKTIESFTKTIDNKHNPLTFPASLPQEQISGIKIDEWKKNALEIAEKICNNLNIKGKNVALLKIYDSIRKNDYIDLNAEKEKYMGCHNIKTMSIISFISESENLRNLFDKRAKELLENTFCSFREGNIIDHKSSTSFSIRAGHMPDCIWDIVKPLYKIGYNKPTVMRFVYKEMEELSGLSLENVAKSYAKQNQIKNVNRGFVISQDEKLMKILKESVNSIIGKNMKKV